MNNAQGEKDAKIFELASDIRKFEIGLFWQRSLFFWGFIGAAFVAYAAIARDPAGGRDILLAVAAFGFVCSVAWSLANRGSKYWQEAWEAKLETYEDKVLGVPLFSERAESNDWQWWGAWRYSVSRLTVALSDFTVAVWFFLGARLFPQPSILSCKALCQPSFLIPVLTFLYVVAMLLWCRSRDSTKPKPKAK